MVMKKRVFIYQPQLAKIPKPLCQEFLDSFGVFLEAFLVPTDVDLDLDGAAAMAMVDTAMVDIKVAHFIKEQSTNLAKNITLKEQQLL